MPRDRAQPRRKFLRIAHPPARLPRFHERVLNHVLGFLAILQNAVGDGEEGATLGADDHFKSLSITVNGRSINVVLAGIHRSICSLDARGSEIRAKNFREIL